MTALPHPVADRLRAALAACVDDPQTLRLQAVEAVREVAHAPVALFYAMATTPGGRHMARNTAMAGEAGSVEPVCRHLQRSAAPYVDGLPDLTRASSLEMRAFVETSVLWRQRSEWHARPITRELYAPQGIGDQIRLLAHDGARPLGWIGAFRYVDQPLFGETDRRRLGPLVGPVTELLAAADAAERAASPTEAGFAVALPDGHLDLVSAQAARWLESAEVAAALTRLLGEGVREGTTVPISAHVVVSVVELRGVDGPRRLVRIEPLEPMLRRPDACLSPAQRAVAELLVAGATHEEIARHSRCGLETVRSHARSIYARLDVSNRLELARALEGGADTSQPARPVSSRRPRL